MREERGNREDEETRQNVPLLESEGQHHRLRQIRLSRWGRDVSTSYELTSVDRGGKPNLSQSFNCSSSLTLLHSFPRSSATGYSPRRSSRLEKGLRKGQHRDVLAIPQQEDSGKDGETISQRSRSRGFEAVEMLN